MTMKMTTMTVMSIVLSTKFILWIESVPKNAHRRQILDWQNSKWIFAHLEKSLFCQTCMFLMMPMLKVIDGWMAHPYTGHGPPWVASIPIHCQRCADCFVIDPFSDPLILNSFSFKGPTELTLTKRSQLFCHVIRLKRYKLLKLGLLDQPPTICVFPSNYKGVTKDWWTFHAL